MCWEAETALAWLPVAVNDPMTNSTSAKIATVQGTPELHLRSKKPFFRQEFAYLLHS